MSRARRVVVAVVLGLVLAGGAALAVPPGGEQASAEEEPAGREETTELPGGRRRHRVELAARRVDLDHVGVHTHANWVVFELPFDVTRGEATNVRFFPRTTVDSSVGAYHTSLACLRVPSVGPVEDPRWAKYTVSGVAGTHRFWEHGLAPTTDPRGYAINVPSRVANAARCWLPALTQPASWRLVVEWEVSSPRP